jgi:hypothetical protein
MVVIMGQYVSAQQHTTLTLDTLGSVVISMRSDSLLQIEPTQRVRELIVCVVFSGRDGQETREYADLITGSPIWVDLKRYRYNISVFDALIELRIWDR